MKNPCKGIPMFYAIVTDPKSGRKRRFGPRYINLCERTQENLRRVFPNHKISIETIPDETVAH